MNNKAITQWLIPILLRIIELFIQLAVVVIVGVIAYSLLKILLVPGLLAIGGNLTEFLLVVLVIVFTLQSMNEKPEKD